MTDDEKYRFRLLFTRYCDMQIKKDNCENIRCEDCIIGKAFEKIFRGDSYKDT